MSWKDARIRIFALVGAVLLAIGGVLRWLGMGNAPGTLVEVFGIVGLGMGLLVVGDVVYHAWLGQGQACRTCGHLRRMKSFRFSGPCPKCGQ